MSLFRYSAQNTEEKLMGIDIRPRRHRRLEFTVSANLLVPCFRSDHIFQRLGRRGGSQEHAQGYVRLPDRTEVPFPELR